ncbi:type II toxin-antitoxin system RatA family toxin [Conexibacter sp. DBS9H8]|uniref:type II toxin-antitoxin system RatA family toxin n=1 Tax=Conexibacter sp. DBS9H8 TaxID=2937801 RepID=UPI00200D3089|nr:SRPBCC family protein [Conexibacter sp. DBS9H8]
MGTLTGSATAEINAPLDTVWAVIADVERAPDWQGGMDGLTALERDGEGRAVLTEAIADIKVRKVKSTVRFSYADGPTRLSWRQEKGELKSVEGAWVLEDLGGRTRATYQIEVDFGRMLGALVRGPVEAAVRSILVAARADELKARVQQGA